MKRHIIAGFAMLIFVVNFIFFTFLLIDIVDGRDSHLEISPHFRASTDNGAMGLVIFFMVCCLIGIWVLGFIATTTSKKVR